MRRFRRLTALMLAAALSILTPVSVLAETASEYEAAEISESESTDAGAVETVEAEESAPETPGDPEKAEENIVSSGIAVKMAKAAPAAGVPITVTKPDTSTLKWFVYAQGSGKGDVVSTKDTYTPTSSDLNKWIEAQAYDPEGTFVGSDRLYFSSDPVCYLNLADGSTDIYDLYIGNQYDNTAEIEEIRDDRTSGSGTPKVYRLELSSAASLFNMNNSSYYVLIPRGLYENLPKLQTLLPGGGTAELFISHEFVVLSLRESFVENYVLCEYAAVGWFGGDAAYPTYPANPTLDAAARYFMFNTLFEKVYAPGYYWVGLNGEKVYVNFNGNGRTTPEYVRQWAAYPYFIVKSTEIYWNQRDAIGADYAGGSPTLFYGYAYPYAVPDYNALILRLTTLDNMFKTEADAIRNCGLMTGGLDYKQSGRLSFESNMREDTLTDPGRAPSNGLIPKNTPLVLDINVNDSAVSEVGVYVNGSLYTEEYGDGTYDVTNGKFRVVVKPGSLTAAQNEKNVISFVSYGEDGRYLQDSQSRVVTDYISVIRTDYVTGEEYSVVFDTNGGSAITAQKVKEGETAIRPEDPEKNGHTFAGWYADEALSIPFAFNTAITENTTVYARWYKNEDIIGKVFTVSFDTNKGLPMEPQKVNGGELMMIPEDPVKNGYIFLGWYKDAELLIRYDFSIPVTEDHTIYARWKKDPAIENQEFIISFDSNGGSEVPSQTVPGAEYVKRPDDPAKNGYIFDGWYKDADLKIPYDFTIPVTEAHTVYARWKKDPEIASRVFVFTFDSMGGLPVEDIRVNGCDYVTDLPVPVKNGYIFDAWCNEETLDTVYDTSVPVAEDHKLFAKWHKDPEIAGKVFTVTFNTNGGSTVASQEVPGAEYVTVPADPVRNAYLFDGWYKDGTLKEAYDFTIPVTESHTVFARWKKDPEIASRIFTFSFDTMGGLPVEDIKVNGCDCVSDLPVPVKNGHIFEAWCNEISLETVYDTTVPVGEDHILYAKWHKDPAIADKIFTVRFEMDGGVQIPEQKVPGGDLITVPASPEKDGYTFVNWYAEPELLTVFDFTVPVTEDITVYARWQLNPDAVKYEVKFNLGFGVPPLGIQYVTTGMKVNRPSDIIRDDGYHIENWYTEKAYISVYDFDAPVYGPLELFAKWVKMPGASDSSGGGGGGSGVSSVTTGGTVNAPGASKVPAWVITEGEWIGSGSGLWMYKYKEKLVANTWMALINPYANTAAGQRNYDWFRFDANGYMVTGWFTDTDGNVYYLQETSDGSRGRMVTGWNVIGGKEYYFNNAEGSGTMGALLRNTVTPDGHRVNARGERIS